LNVLVLRDELPWGKNINVPILLSMGANVTTATSAQMAGIDLSEFCLIMFESNQPESFYDTYKTNFQKFNTYVFNGGRLDLRACMYSSRKETVHELPLPGGVSTLHNNSLEYDNYITYPNHPVIIGLIDPFYGNFASHDAFQNLLPQTKIITVNTLNEPTTISYRYGNGSVIATGMTWEYAHEDGWNYGGMIENTIATELISCDAPGVSLSDWAVYIGLVLIITVFTIRLKQFHN